MLRWKEDQHNECAKSSPLDRSKTAPVATAHLRVAVSRAPFAESSLAYAHHETLSTRENVFPSALARCDRRERQSAE